MSSFEAKKNATLERELKLLTELEQLITIGIHMGKKKYHNLEAKRLPISDSLPNELFTILDMSLDMDEFTVLEYEFANIINSPIPSVNLIEKEKTLDTLHHSIEQQP